MLNLLYQQTLFPVFQNRMYDTEAEAKECQKGDIRLVEDLETGLVYNSAFRPEWMVYDHRYQNEQAVSPLFWQHLEAVASLIEQYMGCESLVEIGCGKGTFLDLLLTRGCDVIGFDPAYEGDQPQIQCKYFAPGMIQQAKGLILRHVLEHIQHPVDFLRQLKEANGGSGKIYIEVPCFDWIAEHRAWFDVFYEHVNYFRLSDFKRIFGEIVDSGRLFGGQYLYVIAELSTLKKPKIDINDRVVFPKDFTHKLTETKRTKTVVWGGASKGVIFAFLKQRAGQPVSTVIDVNPAKQGKFLAGTGLQVKSPEDALGKLPKGSTIYVMNSNYLEEIKSMSNNAFNYLRVDHD